MNYRAAASELRAERSALNEAYRPLGLILGRWLAEESKRRAVKRESWTVPEGIYHITEPIHVGAVVCMDGKNKVVLIVPSLWGWYTSVPEHSKKKWDTSGYGEAGIIEWENTTTPTT